jgi:lipopolysaccharide biosynthesis regulator YciM
MTHADAEVFLARRYLAKGFVDDALRIFMQHVDSVPAEDWVALRDRLLERGRVGDVVTVCRAGKIPIPREDLLQLGDEYLARADVDRAIDLFELIEADPARWEQVVDRLIEMPDRFQQARSIAARHLSARPREIERPRLIKVAK